MRYKTCFMSASGTLWLHALTIDTNRDMAKAQSGKTRFKRYFNKTSGWNAKMRFRTIDLSTAIYSDPLYFMQTYWNHGLINDKNLFIDMTV